MCMLGARRARGGAILHFCARDLQSGLMAVIPREAQEVVVVNVVVVG
jgi:hypothetical protein